MICCILMLSSLVSSVWGTFKVNVTQSSYQAEENGDVTLEWTFTTTAHSSSDSLFIYCELITDRIDSVLFHLHKGVEVPESQDEQFSGRVQWDTDVLREGRLRLHVSRLRTEDSGVYNCKVKTNYGWSSDSCDLNVTDPKFVKMSPSETPLQPRDHQTPSPEDTTHVTGGRSRLAIWMPTVVVIILLMVLGGAVGGYLAKHKVPPYEAAHNKPAPA